MRIILTTGCYDVPIRLNMAETRKEELIGVLLPSDDPGMLERFLREGSDDVAELAGNALRALKGAKTSVGSDIDDRVHAIYQVLQSRRLVQEEESYGHHISAQVRSPREVLQAGHGTCIDLAVLFAACLERMAVEPAIIVSQVTPTSGHALLGYWSERKETDDLAIEPPPEALESRYPVLSKVQTARLWRAGRLHAIDPTACARMLTFEEARQEADAFFRRGDISFAVDVQAARFQEPTFSQRGPYREMDNDEDPHLDAQGQAWDEFCARLPDLLRQAPGKWVAFRGKNQIALSESKREVYAQLVQEAHPLEEVIVHRIEPIPPPIDLRLRAGHIGS